MKKELYEAIRTKRKISQIAVHDDADGLTSAVLLAKFHDVQKIFVPDEFGDTLDPETKSDSEVMVDMVPLNPMKDILVFDHHPNHPAKEERKYTLIWDSVPTSLIVYSIFEDLIPEQERWKVAVGLVGDGQAELIPPSIWKAFPELLMGYGTVYEKYGDVKISSWPVYIRLSSGINAACKLGSDKWYTAYQVLKNATTPLQILTDPSLEAAKDLVEREKARILGTTHPIELNYIRLWDLDSEYKMERHLAPIVGKETWKSDLLVNTKTRRISLRGSLTLWVVEEMNKMGYQINGHPGFCGGRLPEDKEFEDLVKDLQKAGL